MKYKVGDLIQFKNDESLFMKAVQVYNKLEFKEVGPTHTAIIVRIEGSKIYLAEAIGVKPFGEFQYDDWWLNVRKEEGKLWVQRSKIELKNVEKNAKKYYGRKYDWLAIWGILLKRLFNYKSKLTSAFEGDKFLMCSEGALRILYDSSDGKLDLTKEFGKEPEWISPMHLFKSKQLKII